MSNEVSVFNRFPRLFPTVFEKDFLSGGIFDEFEKMFSNPKLRQISVYPTDIYNEYVDGKVISTVIEIACAGLQKEQCSVQIENDTLIVELGIQLDVPADEKDKKEPVVQRKYIQNQIAGRSSSISWRLSDNVDKNNIKVKYQDGILQIKLPTLITKEQPKSKYLAIE